MCRTATLQDAPDTLVVYGGAFTIKLPVEAPPGAPPATYALEGEFHYQACDSARCFAPRSIPFTVAVEEVTLWFCKRVNYIVNSRCAFC